MKEILDELDPWQTHTYLNTNRDFEKTFDKSNLKDAESFIHKIEEFGKRIMQEPSLNKIQSVEETPSPESDSKAVNEKKTKY